MAEQRLNDANVDASLQEMGGETVPHVCAVTGLSILACFRALRHASCKALVLT